VCARHQAFFYSLFFSRLADRILLFLAPLIIFQTIGCVSWFGIAFSLETFPRYLHFPVLGTLRQRDRVTLTPSAS
jgi:hypothetical protein